MLKHPEGNYSNLMISQSIKIRKLPIIISCIFILAGCTSGKVTSSGIEEKQGLPASSMTESPTTSQVVEKNSEEPYLQQCLNDAELLVRTNKKYNNEVTSLYKTIDSAKHYASVSNKVSKNVSSTATPLFEFRVHDMCNNISSLVIKELKAEIGTRNN